MKKIALLISCVILGLTGCSSGDGSETAGRKESAAVSQTADSTTMVVQAAESVTMATQTTEPDEMADAITPEQALAAIKKYNYDRNPELESMEGSEDYTISWEVSENEAGEIVVLYRSYTAAQIRYYINPTTGETYVTEYVEGITSEEERTEESLNVRDYLQ